MRKGRNTFAGNELKILLQIAVWQCSKSKEHFNNLKTKISRNCISYGEKDLPNTDDTQEAWPNNTDLFRSERQVRRKNNFLIPVYKATHLNKRIPLQKNDYNEKGVHYLWNCSNKFRGKKFSNVYLVVRILLFMYSFDTSSYSSLKCPKQGITILCLPMAFDDWWHLLLELLGLLPSLPSGDISRCQRYRAQRMGSAIVPGTLYNPRSVLYLETC